MSYQLASQERPGDVPTSSPSDSDLAFGGVLGQSPALIEAVDFAKKVAQRRLTTVLIIGETGTGKELFARGIHYSSHKAGEPFVAVNCPAIPPSLLESELFGHERGAFTDARLQKKGLMELAGQGTLFLDEITELPTDLQPKLLRALEERRVRRLGGFGEVDITCRVVAATNHPLEQEVADGKFREDLFYRLNVLRVQLPPLRDRHGDIELLAKHFAREVAHEQGILPKDLDVETLAVLRRHTWPGNVRELRNVIQRAALLSEGDRIEAQDLSISWRLDLDGTKSPPHFEPAIRIPASGKSLEQVEAEAIRHTLSITRGNQSAACRILEISRPTLTRKLKKYGIDPSAPGDGA